MHCVKQEDFALQPTSRIKSLHFTDASCWVHLVTLTLALVFSCLCRRGGFKDQRDLKRRSKRNIRDTKTSLKRIRKQRNADTAIAAASWRPSSDYRSLPVFERTQSLNETLIVSDDSSDLEFLSPFAATTSLYDVIINVVVPSLRDVAIFGGDVLIGAFFSGGDWRRRSAHSGEQSRSSSPSPRYRCSLVLSALIMTMTGTATEATDPMQDTRANTSGELNIVCGGRVGRGFGFIRVWGEDTHANT